MASTNVNLNVKGVDKTGGVFARIAKHAKGIFAGIAVGAIGASIAKTVADLGALSDVAQRAGTSAKDITQMSNALNVLGIKANSLDDVANAFQLMAKNTGRVGIEGFDKTLESIAAIPDAAGRGKAAVEAFGRSGLQFMPLIDDVANRGIQVFKDMRAIQPSVSDAAANAGDKVKDAWDMVSRSFQSLWAEAIGKVCGWFDKQFTGGVQQAAYVAYSYIREYLKKTLAFVDSFKDMMANLGETIVEVFTAPFTGNSIKDVLAQAGIRDDEDQKAFEKRFKAITAEADAYRALVQKTADEGGFNLDGLKKLTDTANAKTARAASSEANKWIGGGTYAAQTMTMRAQMRTEDKMLSALVDLRSYARQLVESAPDDDVKLLDASSLPMLNI